MAEFGHEYRLAVFVEASHVTAQRTDVRHVAVQCQSLEVVRRNSVAGDEFVEPYDWVAVTGERAVVQCGRNQFQSAVSRCRPDSAPIRSRLGRRHVRLVGEVRLVECEQILGVGVGERVFADFVGGVVRVPYHRQEIDVVLFECRKHRGDRTRVAPIVVPAHTG